MASRSTISRRTCRIPQTHKYWFDFGTATLDSSYEPYQRRADEILRKAGYVEGQNWITKKFEGAEHSEKAWRLRVDQPLVFLIGHCKETHEC